jgi:hypothetical protein
MRFPLRLSSVNTPGKFFVVDADGVQILETWAADNAATIIQTANTGAEVIAGNYS